MDMLSYFLGQLSGGSSGGTIEVIEYSSIKYNEDDTITFYDEQNNEYIMTCNYEDGKLKSVNFKGKEILLNYENDTLIKVGNIGVDVSLAPAVNTGTGGEQTIIIDASNSTLGDDGILDFTGGLVE